MSVPSWSSWGFDPVLVAVLLAAAGLYVSAYRRASRSPGGRRPGIGHWLPYFSGLLVLVAALFSPLDAVGAVYLLAILPSAWVALPLWAAATWLWAIPSVFDYSAAHAGVHALEHATLFYTGLAMWWLIVDPLPSSRREPNGRRMAYLGFTRLASAGVCLPLVFMTSTVYPRYAAAPRAYGLGALTDQHLAGAGMCFLEFLLFGIAMAAVFISFLQRDAQNAALEDRI